MLAPHWHAQVEINYMFRGALQYRMRGHDSWSLKAGQFCLFWGGLPHQVIDTSDDAFYRRHPSAAGAFLPPAAPERCAQADARARRSSPRRPMTIGPANFARWVRYLRDPAMRAKVDHAINELLLRHRAHAVRAALSGGAGRLRRASSAGCADQQSFAQRRGASATTSPRISATTSTAPTSRRRPTSIRNTR